MDKQSTKFWMAVGATVFATAITSGGVTFGAMRHNGGGMGELVSAIHKNTKALEGITALMYEQTLAHKESSVELRLMGKKLDLLLEID